jgi:hypothetical protein
VADEGVVEVFKHPPLADDILYALGSYDCSYGMAGQRRTKQIRQPKETWL